MNLKQNIKLQFLAGISTLCIFAAIANAQTEPNIQPITSFDALNADNCEAELAQTLTLQGEHTGSSTDNHTLKFVYFTEGQDCLANVSQCPENYIDASGAEACGCIDSFTVNNQTGPVSTSVILGSSDELVALFCGTSQTVTFTVSVQLDAENTEPVYSLNPINLTIDVEAPDAPVVAPTLGSGEESLTVSLSNRDELADEVTAHEVCFAVAGTIQPPADCTLTDGLTPEEKQLRLYCGYSATDNCRQTDDLLTGDYRITGLQNDAEYEVIVAALDDAGNRSANSPVGTARPADFVDFAEGYSAVFNDGAIGETGGCSVQAQYSYAWLALLIGLIGLRRARW